MDIPQIQIQTTDIKMNYQISQPEVRLKQPQATVQMQQPAAIVEIHTTNSEMQTDMTQFYRDLGLKKTGELIGEFAQKGQQAVMQDIGKKVSEGRQLMMSAGKGQRGAAITNIVKQEHGPKSPPISNIDFIPSFNSIDISFTKGNVDINITPQAVKLDVRVNKPQMDFTYGKVQGQMIQRPNVNIDVKQ